MRAVYQLRSGDTFKVCACARAHRAYCNQSNPEPSNFYSYKDSVPALGVFHLVSRGQASSIEVMHNMSHVLECIHVCITNCMLKAYLGLHMSYSDVKGLYAG